MLPLVFAINLSLAPYLVLVGGNVADLWTTKVVLSQGGYEANPLIFGGIKTITVQKALWTGGWVFGMKELSRNGHPKLAKVLGYVIGGVAAGAAVHNYRELKRK